MKTFDVSEYIGNTLPEVDVTKAFCSCFSAAEAAGGSVQIVIPPGKYHLSALEPVKLFSDLTVVAEGAEFYFPEKMDDPKHRTMFA